MAAFLLVTCMRCKHEAELSPTALKAYGVNANASIASFVKRLRCKRCGSASVLATRKVPESRSA